MKRKLALLIAFIAITFSQAIAQDIKLPPVSSLKTEADLDRTSADLVAAAKWLEETPLHTARDKRKEVERFVFMWISASKTVNVAMNSRILGLDDKNPGLVMIYTAAAARQLVEHKAENTKQAQIEALKTIVDVYQHSDALVKDESLLALVKASKKGKIRDWVNK